jgi:ribosomal protein S18 acetylase RimI-like enzyme
MAGPRVRLLAGDEIDEAADLLARAFQRDPITCYALPDGDQRAAVLHGWLRPGVWLAHHLGAVWCSDDMSAVSCWRKPGSRHATPEQLSQAGVPAALELVGPDADARTEPVNELLASRARAVGVPADHWYLSMIGVDPGRRRQGLGSAVLRPVLDTAHARREPVFLETFGPQNVEFYTPHGFVIVEAGVDPSSGLPYWLLLRRDDASE